MISVIAPFIFLILSFFNFFDVFRRPKHIPPAPAAMIIQMGGEVQQPDEQCWNHRYPYIVSVYPADLAMLNVGAAINATTAGRMPLNIRSTWCCSLKLLKEQRYGEDDEKRRKYGSQCSDYAPSYSPVAGTL